VKVKCCRVVLYFMPPTVNIKRCQVFSLFYPYMIYIYMIYPICIVSKVTYNVSSVDHSHSNVSQRAGTDPCTTSVVRSSDARRSSHTHRTGPSHFFCCCSIHLELPTCWDSTAKTFSLSNATWKPIYLNSLSPPVLHQAPLSSDLKALYKSVIIIINIIIIISLLYHIIPIFHLLLILPRMALNSLICADVPLRIYPPTHFKPVHAIHS